MNNNVESIETLARMFPNWEREALALILEDNNYCVDLSIEVILSMTNETDTTHSQMQAVTLADDFLRPPGWKTPAARQMELTDEQLALMLQDELFQKEVELQLGPGYVNNILGAENRQNFPHIDTRGNTTGARRRHTLNNSAQRTTIRQTNYDRGDVNHSQDIPDMGILKGLRTLGEDVRTILGNVGARWTASGSDGNYGGSNAETRPLVGPSRSGSGATSRDPTTSLMKEEEASDEDEEEVINFTHKHPGEGERDSLVVGSSYYGKKSKAA